MKKLNILAILASVAIAFSGLTGCLAGDPDLEPAVAPGYIIGTPTASNHSDDAVNVGWGDAWAEPLTYENGEASFSFTYKGPACGEKVGQLKFKFVDASGASVLTEYGPNAVVEGEMEDFSLDLETDSGNIIASTLVVDSEYTITVKPGAKPAVTISGKAGGGSSSSDSEEEEVVLPTYIIGAPAVGATDAITTIWNSSAAELSAYKDDIATFTFTHNGSTAWESSEQTSKFKLIVPNEDLSDVATDWGKTDITVGAGWAIQGYGTETNMVISGLEKEKTYKISVYANGKTILVKCDTVE